MCPHSVGSALTTLCLLWLHSSPPGLAARLPWRCCSGVIPTLLRCLGRAKILFKQLERIVHAHILQLHDGSQLVATVSLSLARHTAAVDGTMLSGCLKDVLQCEAVSVAGSLGVLPANAPYHLMHAILQSLKATQLPPQGLCGQLHPLDALLPQITCQTCLAREVIHPE